MFKTRGTLGIGLLVAICLVVAPVTASAQVSASKGLKVQVSPAVNAVNFKFTTSTPTAVTVSVGRDKTYGLTVKDGVVKKKHNITVRGLAEATSYYCHIQAVPTRGKKIAWSGACPTQIPKQPTLTVRNNRLLLNNVPFFPRMAYVYNGCPDPKVITDSVQMGLDVMDHKDWGCFNSNKEDHDVTAQELHGIIGGKALWLERDAPTAARLQGMPELLNWNPAITYNPRFTVGSCNTPADDKAVGTYFADLASMSRQKPVVFWTDVSSGLGQNNCNDGKSMYAMLWSVVLAHVAGINLRTQLASDPVAGVQVAPDVVSAVQLFAKRFTTLQPAILTGASVQLSQEKDSAVKMAEWKFGGATYIIAVNTTKKSITQKLATASRVNKLTVLWENRTLRVDRGSITDSFQPLGVHFYKIL